MKKTGKGEEMRSEYKRKDLGKGVRGQYYEAYQEARNLVVLKPEEKKNH